MTQTIEQLQDKITALILERDEWKASAVKLAGIAGDLSERLTLADSVATRLDILTEALLRGVDTIAVTVAATAAREALKAYRKGE